MRQQVCKNKSWKKRVAAAGMAICMACTMPFSVQAENVTEEYNVQENYSAESAAENVSDEKSEVQSYDIETAQTVNQEDSAAQEPSKEEVQLSLQLVAVEKTDTTKPSLKLEEADKLSENITVKENSVIEVKDREGLILLSNVKPEEYANYEVKLITTTGWDLTKPVKVGGKTGTDETTEVAGTEYSFLGLGSDDNPYAGTFGLDTYKKEWNIDGWQASLDRMTPEQREAWIASYKPRNEKFINENLKGEDLVKWKYQRYIKDYVRCIKSIDDEMGRLIAYLEKEGLMDNTVIVYTSDQGFYMGEHGWFDKRFMYEESFRTPLIIRYPAKIKAGSECTALVQNIDYAPTYLDIAGIEKPDYMVGTSLVPLFGGETPRDWREYLYYHYYDYPAIHMVRRHDGVRDSRYKLIHFYGEKNEHNDAINCNELYDLQSDPNELNNLYDNPEYADIQTRLQARLDKFRVDQKVDEY